MHREKISRRELGLLIGIAVYFCVAIMPWSHELYLLNISLTAWMLTSLMFLAPLLSMLAGSLDDREDAV